MILAMTDSSVSSGTTQKQFSCKNNGPCYVLNEKIIILIESLVVTRLAGSFNVKPEKCIFKMGTAIILTCSDELTSMLKFRKIEQLQLTAKPKLTKYHFFGNTFPFETKKAY
jgi:hypothetical protein